MTVGSGWWPGGDGDDEIAYALGLVLVDGLADRFGHFGVAGGTAVLWAEVVAGPAGDLPPGLQGPGARGTGLLAGSATASAER